MDNLSAHKPARVRELIESRGCELIYLPPLLAGLQPDRRSVRQDQGYAAPSRSPHEGRFGRGIGRSAFRLSVPRTPEATSSMPAIVHKSNYCETCCGVRGSIDRCWPTSSSIDGTAHALGAYRRPAGGRTEALMEEEVGGIAAVPLISAP